MTIPYKIAQYCRCTSTIVGVGDYDPMWWPNSKWHNLQVQWDEHRYGERHERVSLWDIWNPRKLSDFSCPLNLNWQCIPSYWGTSLLYNYPGFHSLGSSSKLNQYSFFIRSSWATDWICKQVINSKAQANPFGNLISSELASMLNQSGQNLGSPLASKLFFCR